jgi:hypoxanthine phosphoribosyltransferase
MPSNKPLGFPVNYRVTGSIEITWQATHSACELIRRNAYPFDAILALGRGALIPARLIAKRERIYYWGLNSYRDEDNQRQEINEFQPVNASGANLDNLRCLIIDDVWDSGQTMLYAKDRFPNAKRAVVVSKKKGPEVDWVGVTIPTDGWIVFPWE